MKKGVVGGLVVAGLAGIAGFAALKMSNNDAAAVGGGADLGGGYYEGSSASGGGVPDLTSFIQGLGSGGGVSTANTDDLILDTMLKTMKPSDENADKLQAAVLADALTDTNLASSNMIYNALLERGDVEENPDGTYNYNGYVYMDKNQLSGEIARQAAIQSLGLDAYNALSGGQKSVLISSIKTGKANYADASGVSSKDRLSNGNISGETFDTLLANTLAGTTAAPKQTSSGGGSSSKSSLSYESQWRINHGLSESTKSGGANGLTAKEAVEISKKSTHTSKYYH